MWKIWRHTQRDSFPGLVTCSSDKFCALKELWPFNSPWCSLVLDLTNLRMCLQYHVTPVAKRLPKPLPQVLGLENCSASPWHLSIGHRTLTQGDRMDWNLVAEQGHRPCPALLPREAAWGQCRHHGLGAWAPLDNYCSLEARWNLDWI